jgi:hypothetical protein
MSSVKSVLSEIETMTVNELVYLQGESDVWRCTGSEDGVHHDGRPYTPNLRVVRM